MDSGENTSPTLSVPVTGCANLTDKWQVNGTKGIETPLMLIFSYTQEHHRKEVENPKEMVRPGELYTI